MIKNEIGILREELHSLINENADYNEILRTSMELDELITKFISNKEKDKSEENP